MVAFVNQNLDKMKSMTRNQTTIFEKVVILLIWVLSIIVIYWIILKLTNHSPTIEQIIAGFGGIISTFMFHHHYKLGRLDEFKKQTEKEFERTHNKLDKIDSEISILKIDVASIRSDVSTVRADIAFIRSRF